MNRKQIEARIHQVCDNALMSDVFEALGWNEEDYNTLAQEYGREAAVGYLIGSYAGALNVGHDPLAQFVSEGEAVSTTHTSPLAKFVPEGVTV